MAVIIVVAAIVGIVVLIGFVLVGMYNALGRAPLRARGGGGARHRGRGGGPAPPL